MADKMNANVQYFKKGRSRFLFASIIATVLGFPSICLVTCAWISQDTPTLEIAHGVAFIGMSLFAAAVVLRLIYYYRSRDLNQNIWHMIFSVSISIVCIVILCLYCWQYPVIYQKQECLNRLRNLKGALQGYVQNNKQYPPASEWCDTILNYTKNDTYNYTQDFERNLKCPGAKEGKSSYAMNPDVTLNSPGDVVWVFDSMGGWNLYGRRELMSCNNHEGKGCNILFSGGKIQFVEKENLNELKWK